MRFILFLLRYTPFVLTLLMIVHTALLLRGIDCSVLNHACLSPLPYALYMALSVKMKFCVFHRLALTYTFVLYICITLQSYNAFDAVGINLQSARLVMLIVGVILLTAFFTIKFYEWKRGIKCGACRNCGSR